MRSAAGGADDRAGDRYHLCFALGKALEDRGEFAESFRHYELRQRAEARREPLSRRDHREQHARSRSRSARAEFFAARRGWGAPAPDPIFIVGLPRSGSTLLEQILASHSQVEGTQELPNVQQIVTQPARPRPGSG